MESGCGSAAVSAPGMGVVTGVGKGVETKMAIASNRKDKTASFEEICSVRVGGTLFGVPIRHIYEIVGSARPQPVPLAPGFVGGLVHYRGDVLTTISLRNLLGMPALVHSQPILVLESPGGCFGVLVDAVGEVLTVCPQEFEPNPST